MGGALGRGPGGGFRHYWHRRGCSRLASATRTTNRRIAATECSGCKGAGVGAGVGVHGTACGRAGEDGATRAKPSTKAMPYLAYAADTGRGWLPSEVATLAARTICANGRQQCVHIQPQGGACRGGGYRQGQRRKVSGVFRMPSGWRGGGPILLQPHRPIPSTHHTEQEVAAGAGPEPSPCGGLDGGGWRHGGCTLAWCHSHVVCVQRTGLQKQPHTGRVRCLRL